MEDFPALPDGFKVAEPSTNNSEFPPLPDGFSVAKLPAAGTTIIDTDTKTQVEVKEYETVPQKIIRFKSLGLGDDEAVKAAIKEHHKRSGAPVGFTELVIDPFKDKALEHFVIPIKEGLASVGLGFVSLVDDITRAVGLGNKDLGKFTEEARQDLKQREKLYEEKYGVDAVREVTKALPSILMAAYNYSSLVGMATSEAPLAYAQTRGEGGTKTEAAVSATIAVAIPAAIGLGKAVGSVISYPARKKSELLNTVAESAKQDMLEVLTYAESKGIVLTPAQLSNSSTIEQLTDVVARNPLIKQRFDAISEQNKAILLDAYVNLKNTLSPADVSRAFVKGEVDPFGKEVQKTLQEAHKARKERISEAYTLFDDMASEVKVGGVALKDLNKELGDIKKIAEDTNDPAAFMNIVNAAVRRIKTPEEIAPAVERSIHEALTARKVGAADSQEFKDITLKDLNTISKQLYKLSQNVADPTLKMAWNQTRGAVNDTIALIAKEDESLMATLDIAKKRHIEKENLYGVNPKFKDIAAAANEAHTEDIVSNLLTGKRSRTNAVKLKQEFDLAGKPEMSKALAKRYIEDSFSPAVKEFKDIGKLEMRDILASYSRVDPEVVKLLAGEEAAKELRVLTKLAKSTDSLDKLTSYKIMTGVPNISYIKDLLQGAVQSKLMGDFLSSDKAQKTLLKLWSGQVDSTQGIKLAREAARTVGIADEIFKHSPASKTLGNKAIEVFRAADEAKSTASGPLGKGTYYFTKETDATERQLNTNKKIFKETVNPDDLATMDTVTRILGKPAKYSDLRESVVKDLKLRGFKGVYDNGELVIF